MSETPNMKFERRPSGIVLWSLCTNGVIHATGVENNMRRAKKAAAHALRMHPKGCWCLRKEGRLT